MLIQNLYRKTLKLLCKIKKNFRLRRATNLASLGKLLRSDSVMIIQTLHSCVLWHITPVYVLGQTFHTLDKKSPSNYSLSDFWVLWWKSTKFVMPFLKTQVSLYSNFIWLISIMKYNSCVFFSSNLVYFGQKETMEVQILRLFKWQEKLRILNWALKILQIFTLSSFPAKHARFELKKSTEKLCFMTMKSGAKFERKLTCGLIKKI